MGGGEISINTATQGGGGVYVTHGNANTFAMSGGAVVKQEVFLASGRKIIVSGPLTPPDDESSAEIMLLDTTNGTVVLEGASGYSLTASDVAKFTLLNSDGSLLYQDGKGVLIND
jgi:hypothetical protein